MAYFWQERAEGFAAGQVPPLGGCAACEAWHTPCVGAGQEGSEDAAGLSMTAFVGLGVRYGCAAGLISSSQTSHLREQTLRVTLRSSGGARPAATRSISSTSCSSTPRMRRWRRITCRCGHAGGSYVLAKSHPVQCACVCARCSVPISRSLALSLSPCGGQALDSYTGRMAPRLALLSAERLEQGVVQRVLRWAAAGGAGDADPGTLLAEDAAEVGRGGAAVGRQVSKPCAAALPLAWGVLQHQECVPVRFVPTLSNKPCAGGACLGAAGSSAAGRAGGSSRGAGGVTQCIPHRRPSRRGRRLTAACLHMWRFVSHGWFTHSLCNTHAWAEDSDTLCVRRPRAADKEGHRR